MTRWKGYTLTILFLVFALWSLISIFMLISFRWDVILCEHSVEEGKRNLEKKEIEIKGCTRALESSVNLQVQMFRFAKDETETKEDLDQCYLEDD
jgi:hypothetical protein